MRISIGVDPWLLPEGLTAGDLFDAVEAHMRRHRERETPIVGWKMPGGLLPFAVALVGGAVDWAEPCMGSFAQSISSDGRRVNLKHPGSHAACTYQLLAGNQAGNGNDPFLVLFRLGG